MPNWKYEFKRLKSGLERLKSGFEYLTKKEGGPKYETKNTALNVWKTTLNAWKTALNAWNATLNAWNVALNAWNDVLHAKLKNKFECQIENRQLWTLRMWLWKPNWKQRLWMPNWKLTALNARNVTLKARLWLWTFDYGFECRIEKRRWLWMLNYEQLLWTLN